MGNYNLTIQKAMKTLLFRIILMLQTTLSLSQEQEFINEFRVTEKDLTTNEFAIDSTANALVLYEYGNSYFDQTDFHLITEYKKKIKILKKEGFDQANVEIYLYRNDNGIELVNDISATTYSKVNGKVQVTKLKKDRIYSEKYNENFKLVKFTLPSLTVGSVITYSYKLDTPFLFNFHDWYFQEEIPKLYSEYRTKIPANYEYSIKLRGYQELDVNESEIARECVTEGLATADCTEARYVMKDIPAFVEEEYMTTKKNYLSKIEYELKAVQSFSGVKTEYTKTWKTVDKDIWKNRKLGKELRKTSVLKNILPLSIVEEPNSLEKAKQIYRFVQEQYTWNSDNLHFDKVSIKNLVNEKTGNISEINGLLYALLKTNGIEAYPVLSSTRNNGVPTKLFPVLSEFNYLLVNVSVDGQEYLLDASEKYLLFGQIPFRCLNQYGRKLDVKKGSEWIPIQVGKPSRVLYGVELILDENGHLSGILKSNYSGYHALRKKRNHADLTDDFLDENEEIKVQSYTVDDDGKESGAFREIIDVEYEDVADDVQTCYLDPFLLKFFTKNPFQLQRRSYPIDFGYKDTFVYYFTLELPDTYEVVEHPENIRMQLPNKKGELKLMSSVMGNKLRLNFALSFKEAIYEKGYYEALKQLMEQTVRVQTKSLIVLKKKPS